MGDINLANLISEVRSYFAGRGDLTDEVIITHLNLAQTFIARKHDWEELERIYDVNLTITATAEDDKFIAFPPNLKEIFSFRLITGTGESRKLTYVRQRAFDKMVPEPEFYARNKPQIYTVHNNIAELWPIPDSAYRVIIRIGLQPTKFSSSDTGITSDLDEKDDILIYLACSTLYDKLGEYDRSNRFFGIANSRLDDAYSEQVSKPDLAIKPAFESLESNLAGKYWADPFIRGVRG